MRWIRKSFVAAALAAVLWAPHAGAQRGADPPEDRQDHYWVVLLDVSFSFDQRDARESRALGQPGYKLRNELLSLFQTVLFTLQAQDPTRSDHLAVYVFGEGVERVEELTTDAILWADIQEEDWWQEHVPAELGARTDLFEALRRAREHFEAAREEGERHLLLISDGELDTGQINRPPGGPLQREELELYRNQLSPEASTMRWFAEHDVEVLALILDEELDGSNDWERQREIGQRLYEYSDLGDSPLDWARGLIEDLAGESTAEGRLPYSEGPYVMQALAQAFGGRASSVRYDNALRILWESFFPGMDSKRVRLPPETREMIVVAPKDAPVPLKVQVSEDEPLQELSILYDRRRTSYTVTPPGPLANDLQVRYQPTSQYVTWWIDSPHRIIEFDRERMAQKVRAQLRGTQEPAVVPIPLPNVRLHWREGAPPDQLEAGQPAPLTVELLWKPPKALRSAPTDQEAWGVEEWREHLRQIPTAAKAEVSPPGLFSSRTVELDTRVPDDLSDAVLEITGQYEKTTRKGHYQVDVELTLGVPPDASPPMKAPPMSFFVRPAPIDASLVLRPLREEGIYGDPVVLDPPTTPGARLKLDSDTPREVVFEWRVERPKECEKLDQLKVVLTPPGRTFGPAQNALGDQRGFEEDGQLVCYRTPEVRLETGPEEPPVEVLAHNGSREWKRRIVIPSPPPKWPWALLLLLLAAAVSGWVFRDRLMGWWAGKKLEREAQFPLAVRSNGERVAWTEGEKKRLLLRGEDSGIRAEFSGQKPGRGEPAAELRPVQKKRYRLRTVSGSDWWYRLVKKGAETKPDFLPLGGQGETFHLLDFAEEAILEVRHGDQIATIGHSTVT